MVVLTVIVDSNDCTVRFREPLGKLQYSSLLSCVFYNSRDNTKKGDEISISDDQGNVRIVKFLQVITHSIPSEKSQKKKFIKQAGCSICDRDWKSIQRKCLFRSWSSLSSCPAKQSLKPQNVTNRLSSFNFYSINCHLLDKISKQYQKKTRRPVSTRKELRVDFDKRRSGFSLTISKHDIP